MSSRLAFVGSKRKARQLAAGQREVARVKRELREIADLAPLIRDDAHLEQLLADVPDEAQRAAVRTLITPFLRYRIERVYHALATPGAPPPLVIDLTDPEKPC